MTTYSYDFISRYSRLSSILELDSYLAQQTQREAFLAREVVDARRRVEVLGNLQQQLDEAWKGVRWTMDIIQYARDKNIRGGLPLSIVYAPAPSPDVSPLMIHKTKTPALSSSSDVGYHSDRSSGGGCDQNSDFTNSEFREERKMESGGNEEFDDIWQRHDTQPGILRVFAAYSCGLSRSTSVKLHVTPRTTSREVINLVVQQLNHVVMMKGLPGPLYLEEQLSDFCLVAVIGSRERVMRDDYQPLQLQNPWTKGRLFVRMRRDTFAALDQGHVTTV